MLAVALALALALASSSSTDRAEVVYVGVGVGGISTHWNRVSPGPSASPAGAGFFLLRSSAAPFLRVLITGGLDYITLEDRSPQAPPFSFCPSDHTCHSHRGLPDTRSCTNTLVSFHGQPERAGQQPETPPLWCTRPEKPSSWSLQLPWVEDSTNFLLCALVSRPVPSSRSWSGPGPGPGSGRGVPLYLDGQLVLPPTRDVPSRIDSAVHPKIIGPASVPPPD